MSFQNNLFLTSSDSDKKAYVEMMEATVRAIAASMTDEQAYAGMPPYDLRAAVRTDELLPAEGCGFEAVLEEIKAKILPNLVRPASTNYMAHLHSAALVESVAAELIIATFNQSMDSWDQAPVATEIEVEVIRNLCRMYGYDENSDGVFTSGGSQSNLSGLLLARDWFCNEKLHYDIKKHGLPENFRKLRMYASEISHFSMEKSAHLMGMGYEAVVKVPVNSAMQMDVEALKKLIEKDIADGNLPFCIAATVGTTDFGSIDPLKELRELCDRYGMWLHADAAYGSGVVLSRKYACRVAGLALADSITVDFHKMFLLPISCSASLIKDKRNFDALTIHADYLNREEDEEDGYINLVNKSMQTTRRFDALKVWVSFKMRGADGWSDLITGCIDNAAYFYSRLAENPDVEVITAPEISSVVFRVLPKNGSTEDGDTMNKRVRRELLHHHGVVIGQTVCNGNVCLKFTLLNPLQSHAKLDELLDLILQLSFK
ncbi:MAG: aminotransferase class I/II-fold pyridoxal phosphate-dependent enzyme [Lentisphaerae bacterium]|nr:aminotransferase class I/II-fold pyridoxal phosphate-dependent enzyme [Lentisphaerota bacterium]